MRSRLAPSFLLAGALVIFAACDKKPEQPKVEPKPNPAPAAVDTRGAMDKAKAATSDAANKATGAITDATKPAVDGAKSAAETAKDAAKSITLSTPDTAKTVGTAATDATKSQASMLVQNLEAAIKNNKLGEAATYMNKIESLKENLPPDLQDKFIKLKADYNKLVANTPLNK